MTRMPIQRRIGFTESVWTIEMRARVESPTELEQGSNDQDLPNGVFGEVSCTHK